RCGFIGTLAGKRPIRDHLSTPTGFHPSIREVFAQAVNVVRPWWALGNVDFSVPIIADATIFPILSSFPILPTLTGRIRSLLAPDGAPTKEGWLAARREKRWIKMGRGSA